VILVASEFLKLVKKQFVLIEVKNLLAANAAQWYIDERSVANIDAMKN